MISSVIDGRVRLRSTLLADTEISKKICDSLQKVHGVTSVQSNLKTHSILIEYDPKRIPASSMISALPLLKRIKALEGASADTRKTELFSLVDELEKLLSAV